MARHGRGRRGEDRGATAHRPRRPLPPRRDGGRSTAATLAEVLNAGASIRAAAQQSSELSPRTPFELSRLRGGRYA